MNRSLSVLIAGSLLLGSPLSAFAGSANGNVKSEVSVSTEEILENIVPDIAPTAVPVSNPADGKGGGGMDSSLYYPSPYYGGGVTVSADITKTVTPDYVAITAYCESGKMPSRQAVRDALNQLYTDIKNAVGKDGRVRKSGTVSAYPYYDSTGQDTSSFNGSLSVFVRFVNVNKAQAIADYIEQKGCSVNWDVRLVNAQAHEMTILDELATQLNTRKTVFEKLLQKRLTRIIGATLSTWVDSYGSYDPDTNTVDATTSLSVTFDLGGRATLPTIDPAASSAKPAAAPRG